MDREQRINELNLPGPKSRDSSRAEKEQCHSSHGLKPEDFCEGLRAIIDEFLTGQNLELVDLLFRQEGKDLVLRIFVDKPEGGIILDECAYLNEKIGLLLDEKAGLGESYILEVSSPGLDRPLMTKKDFNRCLNRRVKVFLSERVEGKMEWAGVIVRVSDEGVSFDIEGKAIDIPLSKIQKGKQIIG